MRNPFDTYNRQTHDLELSIPNRAEYDQIDASQVQENLEMTIKPIRDETDYDVALSEIDSLMGVARGTPESDRLEVLVTLVETYEAERWSIDAPDRGQVPNAS